MAAQIYQLPKATLADIPRVLRAIADSIEAGEYGSPEAAAVVLESTDGEIETFGAGAADYYRTIALFRLGSAKMESSRILD